jgi:putative peptidoglycan lipid II flippase
VNTARSIGILVMLNALGAMIALAHSVVLAFLFGTSRALEVYFAAATLQTIAAKLTQTGQLGEIFLPIYHRLREEHSPRCAQQAFAVLLNWVLLLSVGLAAALWFAAPLLLRVQVMGFSTADQARAAAMFRAILPLLAIQVTLALMQTLANAERWFGRPEAVGVTSRGVMLAAVAALAAPMGAWAMVAALWIGHLVQLVGQAWLLWRMGYRHRASWAMEHFRVRTVFRRLGATLMYVGATQVYTVALDAGLSLLPRGTYAVFKYVQQLFTKVHAVLLRPVSVVFFTHVSEAVHTGMHRVRLLARTALGRCLGIAVLALAMVLAGGRPLLAGLWGSGRFRPEHVVLAWQLLAVLLAFLPAVALSAIGRKTAMSLGLVRWQYGLAAAMQAASAALAWWCIPRWHVWGAIAVLACNALAAAAVPTLVLLWRRREAWAFFRAGDLARWLTAGAVGVAVARACAWALPAGWTTPGAAGRGTHLGAACLLSTAAAATCLAGAWVLGVADIRKLASRLRGKPRGVTASPQSEPK